MVPTVPRIVAEWMRPFSGVFSSCLRGHVLVLVAGTVLSPGRRTVTAALRIMGLEQAPDFALYHRVLSTARWSARQLARRVLLHLIATFVPEGPIVIGVDGAPRSRPAASIATRCAPATAILSKPAACVGCA
jgi:hypothetical protein